MGVIGIVIVIMFQFSIGDAGSCGVLNVWVFKFLFVFRLGGV